MAPCVVVGQFFRRICSQSWDSWKSENWTWERRDEWRLII